MKTSCPFSTKKSFTAILTRKQLFEIFKPLFDKILESKHPKYKKNEKPSIPRSESMIIAPIEGKSTEFNLVCEYEKVTSINPQVATQDIHRIIFHSSYVFEHIIKTTLASENIRLTVDLNTPIDKSKFTFCKLNENPEENALILGFSLDYDDPDDHK